MDELNPYRRETRSETPVVAPQRQGLWAAGQIVTTTVAMDSSRG